MKTNTVHNTSHSRLPHEAGKAGWILLWLLGIPLPVLLLIYFLKGCN